MAVYIIVFLAAAFVLWGGWKIFGQEPLTDEDFVRWLLLLPAEIESQLGALEREADADEPDKPSVAAIAKRTKALLVHLSDFEIEGDSGSLQELREQAGVLLDDCEQASRLLSSDFIARHEELRDSARKLISHASSELPAFTTMIGERFGEHPAAAKG